MTCFLCLQALKCTAVISPPEQASQRQHYVSSGARLRAGLCSFRRERPRNRVTMHKKLNCWQNLYLGRCSQDCWTESLLRSSAVSPDAAKLRGSFELACYDCLVLSVASINSRKWMQAELDAGHSIAALRRFSDNLARLPENGWGMLPNHHLCLGLYKTMISRLFLCAALLCKPLELHDVIRSTRLICVVTLLGTCMANTCSLSLCGNDAEGVSCAA